MVNWVVNDAANRLFEALLRAVARLGLPLIVSAWLAVLITAAAMAVVLCRRPPRIWLPAVAAGLVSLAAHLIDFFGTLRICPDLAFEANPIWCIVVREMGLKAAWWYGFTGKILLAVLGFEFFSYYLARRGAMMPDHCAGFFDFWRRFGATGRRISFGSIALFFSFLFGLIGPFCFYVAYLNTVTDPAAYERLPAMPVMLLLYLAFLTLLFLAGNYLSFRRSRTAGR